MSLINDISINTTCRICLNNNAMNDIFSLKSDNKSRKLSQISCVQMMTSVLSISVCEGDGLPLKLCRKCYAKVTSAYKLKILAQKSYKKLVEYLSKHHNEFIDNKEVLKDEIKEEVDILILENGSSVKDEVHFRGVLSEKKINRDICDTESNLKIEYDNYVNDDDDDDDDKPLIAYEIVPDKCCDSAKSDFKNDGFSLQESNKKHTRRKKNEEVLEKQETSVCDLCGKQVSNLLQHRRCHEPVKRQLPCGECPKVFTDYSSRRRHRNVLHRGELYYCEICKKHFKRGSQHKALVHSVRSRKFECPTCHKAFYSGAQLRQHRSVHTLERPFLCPLCPKTFRVKGSLDCHRRSVHEKERKNICQYCSKGFFSVQNLDEHIRTHTGERIYKCGECGKSFSRSSVFRRHELAHRGVRSHTCPLCSKSFIDKRALKVHMVCHTNEKNFACKYCGAKFGRIDSRNRHQRSTHENIVTIT